MLSAGSATPTPMGKRQTAGHPADLADQAALAHPGRSLDQHNGAATGADAVDQLTQYGELAIPSADRRTEG